MILNEQQSSVITSGDIKNNQVGIDVNNLNFITTLLTSNLYSNPIESFFRETVSNAWDSQVEAGNTNTPILIDISSLNDDKISVAIRDYGTGLSPERFDAIYRNIGSSTKRESNEYIGALGLGRFTCLAVSDMANITSYYNGKCYNYLMYKDGDTLNIDLLGTTDTTNSNGVCVKVNIDNVFSSRQSIIRGLSKLAYFEQIYVDIDSSMSWLKDFVDRFNARQVHEFNNFKVCSLEEVQGMHFLMGNVLYSNPDSAYNEFDNNPNIAIKCDIGSIDIIPNREAIRLSQRTKDVLSERVADTNAEIFQLAKEVRNSDFNTVEEWYKTMCGDFELKVFEFDVKKMHDEEKYSIIIDISEQQLIQNNIYYSNCTIRGEQIPDGLEKCYNNVKHTSFPNELFTYDYIHNQFCKTRYIYLYQITNSYYGSVFYIDAPFKETTKRYIREQNLFENRTLFINRKYVKRAFYKMVREIMRFAEKTYPKIPIDKKMLRMIWTDIKDVFNQFSSYNNSDVPQDWLQSIKVQKDVKTDRNAITIHRLVDGRTYNSHIGEYNITTVTDVTFKELLNIKQTVIYAEKGSQELRFLYRMLTYRRYIFIEVAKSNLKYFKNVSKYVYANDFLKTYNKRFAQMMTAQYLINSDFARLGEIQLCGSSKPFLKTCGDLSARIAKVKNMRLESNMQLVYNNLYKHYVDNNWLDKSMIDFAMNKNVIRLLQFISEMDSFSINKSLEIAINYFAYKHKIRVDGLNYIQAYKFLKTI